MNKGLKYILVEELKDGMTLGETIYDNLGNILLSKGIVLKKIYINKIRNLKMNKVQIQILDIDTKENDTLSEENNQELFIRTKSGAEDFIKKTFSKVSFKNNNIEIDKIQEIVNRLINELLDNQIVTTSLDRLRSVDDYTFEHSVNVSVLALILGINLGYERKELLELGIGAILHDIGKILIPDEILNKPGPLTAREFAIIKEHTTYGYEALKNNKDSISDIASNIVLCHHERPDGLGYPNGIKNELIHTFSKIVAITDVFDALTSDRVYKNKVEPINAIEYIAKMAGVQFDSDLVYSFIECVALYPRGSIVKLNTDEIGMVIESNRMNPQKPKVKLLIDRFGNRLDKSFEIDINRNPDISIIKIIRQKQNA